MKGKFNVIKLTVIGGVVFLFPIVVIYLILQKLYEILIVITEPVALRVPVPEVGGVAMLTIVTVTAIILICFLAGLAARTALAASLVGFLEDRLLSNIPIYIYVNQRDDCQHHRHQPGGSVESGNSAFR